MKLYVDFDDVLVNSNKAIRTAWSKDFDQPFPEQELTKWDFGLPVGDRKNYVKEVFEQDNFWDNLELYEDAIKYLSLLKNTNKFEIILCTVGTTLNIEKKMKFLKENNLNNIFNYYIYVEQIWSNQQPKKTFISDGILIDDNKNNLTTVQFPILLEMGSDKEWNRDYRGSKFKTWKEVYEYINNSFLV